MKNEDFLKERYEFEHERNNRLNNDLGSFITILVVLFGAIAYFLKDITLFENLSFCVILFFLLMGIAICCLCNALYQIIRGFLGHFYFHLPLPQEVLDQKQKYKNYYDDPYFSNYDENQKESLVEKAVEAELFSCYAKACEENKNSNDDKSRRRINTLKSFGFGTVFILLSVIPFFLISQNHQQNILQVKIVNANNGGVVMDSQNEKAKPPQPPKPLQGSKIENGIKSQKPIAPQALRSTQIQNSKPIKPPVAPQPLQNTRIEEGAKPPTKKAT